MNNMDGNENIEEIYYEEADTRGQILLHCYNAIAATDMLDCYVKKDIAKKEGVRRKALEVIDYYISEIHAEIFDETNED
jgi:hypothetical protein